MEPFNPWKSTLYANAWQAILTELGLSRWVSHKDVMQAATSTGMIEKTADNFIRRAADFGVVYRRGTYNQKSRKDWREWHLAPLGDMNPAALLWVKSISHVEALQASRDGAHSDGEAKPPTSLGGLGPTVGKALPSPTDLPYSECPVKRGAHQGDVSLFDVRTFRADTPRREKWPLCEAHAIKAVESGRVEVLGIIE